MDGVEENYCHYISSHGIMKSCDVYSRNHLHYIYKVDPVILDNIKEGCTLYIKVYSMRDFIDNHAHNIKVPFVLVTGDGDLGVQDIFPDETSYITFLNNPMLIHWFSINTIFKHPKITLIPYGLDYHTMTRERKDVYWANEVLTSVEQEKQLMEINKQARPFWEREYKCYVNCNFLTSTRYGNDRIQAINSISNELMYIEPSPTSRLNSWRAQTKYAFVLSPHGNGLDCIRTWEALILGCIPIVKKSRIDDLYEGLPVLIVDKWSDINRELLDKTIIEFRQKYDSYKFEKLTLKYWSNLISSYSRK